MIEFLTWFTVYFTIFAIGLAVIFAFILVIGAVSVWVSKTFGELAGSIVFIVLLVSMVAALAAIPEVVGGSVL